MPTIFDELPVWPSTLPQCPLIDGLQESEAKNVVSTPLDVGASKTRMRSRAGNRPHLVSYWFTSDQLEGIFLPFFRNDTSYGALPFVQLHWRTQTQAIFLFDVSTATPTWTDPQPYAGSMKHKTSFALVQIPSPSIITT
jgi:hypothetical protein